MISRFDSIWLPRQKTIILLTSFGVAIVTRVSLKLVDEVANLQLSNHSTGNTISHGLP